MAAIILARVCDIFPYTARSVILVELKAEIALSVESAMVVLILSVVLVAVESAAVQ